MRAIPVPVALILAFALGAPAAEDVYRPPEGVYAKLDFDFDWRFSKGSFPFASTDDSAWEHVSTPHTYSARDGYQGVNNPTSDLGPNTYRKHFRIPAAYAGRQVFLEFQASATAARSRSTATTSGGTRTASRPSPSTSPRTWASATWTTSCRSRPTARWPKPRPDPFCVTFDGVAFAPGEITATGYDAAGKALATSTHLTAGPPAKLRTTSIQGPGGLRADGQDVVLLETEVLDAAGRRCPNAFDVVAYTVTGPAAWQGGIWEEDVARYVGRTELPVICGVHRVALRSTLAAGVITIAATAHGLATATITIASHPVRLVDGLSPDLPNITCPALPPTATYGPDLPPAPRPPAGFFDDHDYRVNPPTRKEIADNHALGRLHVAFVGKGEVATGAKDGAKIYADEAWTFAGLPAYLQGADYIRVANRNAGTAAAEGFVFTLLKPAVVYLAYDDRNPALPVNNSGTTFTPTGDAITINGHRHRIYRTAPLKALEPLYLGTNNWPDTPPAGVDNCIVLVQPIGNGQDAPKPGK